MDLEELTKKTGISEVILKDIQQIAVLYNVEKIVLFGSRARGTHQKKSDIDLAVYGCSDFTRFSLSIEENVWTLLEFDLIQMDETAVSEELKTEIERDGIVIYEKI
jgi:predicted nucleotidyltransferase